MSEKWWFAIRRASHIALTFCASLLLLCAVSQFRQGRILDGVCSVALAGFGVLQLMRSLRFKP